MRYLLLLVLLVPLVAHSHSNVEFLDIIDTTKKSVVFVENTPIEGSELRGMMTTPPEQPEEEDRPPGQYMSFGTGYVVEGGYIITNHHVIENASILKVYFENSQQPYIVTVVGSDEDIDIAVLKPGPDFPKVAPLEYRTEPLRQGEDVWAVGHPLGFEYSVTKGILSSLHRREYNPWQPTIQTDTAINQGNSGGPLLDMHGKVIGTNNMLVSRSGAFSGIALAIDHKTVQRATKTIIKYGEIKRPLLGALLGYDKKTFKVQIEGVSGAAELAGIEEGDLFLEVDNKEISDITEIFDILAEHQPGDTLVVKVQRDKNDIRVFKVVLQERKDSELNIQPAE